ncbi:glycosyltransferase family 39 protein [bacterium]|nr:glycosyltransferase family 39 protein [bacterium]
MRSLDGRFPEIKSQTGILLVLLFVPGILLLFIFPLQFPMFFWDEGLWNLGPKHAVTLGDPFAYGWYHIFLSPLHFFTTKILYELLSPSLIYSKWMNGLFSIGIVIFTYLLASTLYNRRNGFIAAILVMYNSMMIISARFAMLEPEVSFYMLGAAYFWFTRKKSLVLISTLFLASALLVKVYSLVLFPALILGQLLLREQNSSRDRQWLRRVSPYQWAALLAGMSIAIICYISISYINLELFKSTWLGHTTQRESMFLFGGIPEELLSFAGIFRFVYKFMIHMPVMVILSLAGVFISLKYRKTGVYFFIFWFFLTFLMVSSQVYRPERYYFPIIPALAILAASFFDQLFSTWTKNNKRKVVLILVISLMCIFQILRLFPYWREGASSNRAFVDTASWINANIEADEPILAMYQIALFVPNPVIPASEFLDERWRASIDPDRDVKLPFASYMVMVFSRRAPDTQFNVWANEFVAENYSPVKSFAHFITVFKLKE